MDIIEVNFADTYRNLTLKTRSALDFYVKNCKSDLMVILDDDVLITNDAIFKPKFGRLFFKNVNLF